jgi:hypothetical protein
MTLQRRFAVLVLSVLGALALATCGGSGLAPSGSDAPPTAASGSRGQPEAASAPGSPTPSSQAQLPQACALLTTADVEKITGYGNGVADTQNIGEGTTNCVILAAQGKFKVELAAGKGVFPVLPTEKSVDLEGGAKGIVKDSGLGQGWMSLVEFSDYSVTMLFSGSSVSLDPDKKIANLTKADGSVISFAQAYEALARAIAHNAASGTQVPSGVGDVNAKADPCALLTLDDVKQAMADFTMTGPETEPSAYGSNRCTFRGQSDTLKARAIVGVLYLTQRQFEEMSSNGMATGMAKKSDIGGVTMYDLGKGFGTLLQKGNRYVRFSIDLLGEDPSTLEQTDQGLRAWMPQLAAKIAARL